MSDACLVMAALWLDKSEMNKKLKMWCVVISLSSKKKKIILQIGQTLNHLSMMRKIAEFLGSLIVTYHHIQCVY